MDILSDVKITGNLETVGNVKVGYLGGGTIDVSRIRCTGGTVHICANYFCTNRINANYVTFEKSLYASNGATATFCNVSFGRGENPSILDLTNAKVIGLETRSICRMTIPSNCSVFTINKDSCGGAYENLVPVSSFMKYECGCGDDWRQVQLDISFKRWTTNGTEMCALIGSFSQAFSEPKTMEFIVG